MVNLLFKLYKNKIPSFIIVITTDIERIDRDFTEQFDSGLFDEVVRRFREVIDSCCERVEFFTKILFDFNSYQYTGKPNEKTISFVKGHWRNYATELEGCGIDSETVEALSKVIVYNVIRRRYEINRIKREVSL